jgi:tetratricopeptide (TPR) repeat protein
MNSISRQSEIPRVFISYSYDSEEQMDRVLSLADSLRKDGIDCNIDQYVQSPAKGWYRWMMDEIEEADFVLMICTPQYIQRFRGDEKDEMAMGVTWEGAVITQELYHLAGENLKYIPILLSPRDADSIPNILRNTSRYLINNPKGYELLYRRLSNQHDTPKPRLGNLHIVLPKERRQFFAVSQRVNDVQEKEPCNLPRKSYRDFIGRDKEINEILERISPDYRQHITIVRGIGGVGKTALAVEIAYRCWAAKKNPSDSQNIPIFDAIIFTSSKATDMVSTQLLNRPEKEPLLIDIFRVISEVLSEPTITQVLAVGEQQKKAKEALKKQSTLLIVDNMETLLARQRSAIKSFLNDVPLSTQVIITTRESSDWDSSILIDSLTQAESFDLMDRHAKTKEISINHNWKRQVHKRFGGIPIALIYSVGKIAAGYKFDDIIGPNRIPAEDLERFCFDSSVAPIKNTAAYNLLLSITLFRDPPCREALISVAGLIDGNKDVIDALAKLHQLSLVTEEKGRYIILSITREYAMFELGSASNVDFRRLARERWYNWYLEFTQHYGGQDWAGWRAKYNRLGTEWLNIETVLEWYAEKEEWQKVLELWENVDNYADLSGYWRKRREWWAILGKKSGSTKVRVKALSEKGLTLILMGKEHYPEAELYLNRAWDFRDDADIIVQATLANYLAVLSKVQGKYYQAHNWLDMESKLLQTLPPDMERERKRYQARNLYYRAEINYLNHELEAAKNEWDQVVKLSEEIGWQRFKNYAKNNLAEIYLRQGDLELAETTIKSGLSVARQAKESRRIALYHASYARLYYQLAQEIGCSESRSQLNIDKAREYAMKALKVFSKEWMEAEQNEINDLLKRINEF